MLLVLNQYSIDYRNIKLGQEIKFSNQWMINNQINSLMGEKPKERLPKRKTCGSRHQRLFEENV